MKIFSLLLLFVATVLGQQVWSPFSVINQISEGSNNIKTFFDGQSDNMKSFFQNQKNKVENAFSSSYERAMEVTDSVYSYVEEQQKKIGDELNSYSQQFSDKWSYLPVEAEEDKMDMPEVVLSVPGIIASSGYPVETHIVVSQGYILNIHRIPRSKTSDETPAKTVILQHGLFASSADWILNGPKKSLAYALSDAGYDVWMTNIRGNKYSKEHSWLKTNSKSYWNFSWHDVALYDIPNIIDYILNLKGDVPLTFVGHSMGTSILFAMLTLRPEYNDLLTGAVALAPVVFMSDIKSPLKSLAPIASNVAYMEMLYGSHEFMPKHSALGKIVSSCDGTSKDLSVCKNALFYICGADEEQFDPDRLPIFLASLGTGTSWKTAVHFAQELIADGKFQQFDYGSRHNNLLYGQETPPEYDLSKVKLPIALFYANNDLLSSEKDVITLREKLPKSTQAYLIPHPNFNHLDYLLAKDAPQLVNEKLLEVLDGFNDNNFFIKINFKRK